MPQPLSLVPFGVMAYCIQHIQELAIGSEAKCLMIFIIIFFSFETILMQPRLIYNSNISQEDLELSTLLSQSLLELQMCVTIPGLCMEPRFYAG